MAVAVTVAVAVPENAHFFAGPARGRGIERPMRWLERIVGFGCVLVAVTFASGAHALTDASVEAGTCDAGSGLACEMCDTSGYTPTELKAPLGPMAGLCSDADISGFITACGISTGSQSACSAWQAMVSSTCLACILTPESSSEWGLAVCATTSCAYNSAGCIDLALNQVSMEQQAGGTGSCGDVVQAAFGCEDYACSTCTGTDFTTCVTSAVSNECASYAAPLTSMTGACAAMDGSASETSCFPQTDTDLTAMAELFCGGLVAPPPDAGSDSGTTTTDSGTGFDSGTTPKDAGKADSGGSTGDGGVDAGTGGSFNTGGCHCDAAGSGGSGDALLMMGMAGFVVVALGRRKRRLI